MPARRSLTALALVASLGAATLLGAAPAEAAADTSCVPPPVAHRGDSTRAPENTIPAFAKALALGVSRLELDVRFTADGVPVLMHDRTLTRTTDGVGPISALTYAQLQTLDAGSWFSPEYNGLRVPTLREVLDLGRQNGGTFLIELKTRPTPQQMDDFLNEIRWLGMLDRVRVMSFDPQTVLDVRAAQPGLRTAIIDTRMYRRPDSVLQYGSTYIVNQWSVTQWRADKWRRAGIEIRPWTVNRIKDWRRMAADKVSATITDQPRRYLIWARSMCR
jgi:glycerophosphoryl diester phosphodiesterase